MKIIFNKLQTSKETIQVSLDGGTTWNSYVVSEIIESGIPLDENQEYDKIHIKGSATVLKNLDVVKSIEIPESNNTKDEMFTHNGASFYGNLVNVKIPEGFTSIDQYAFYNCISLTSIEFPEGLTFIDQYAFRNCSRLTSIEFPESLTSISSYAFQDCTSLTSINLPESLTSIGQYAFQSCTSLKTINFKGTEEQWNAISKGKYWNAGCPSNMVINFNYQGE